MNRDLQIAAGLSEEENGMPRLKTLAEFERNYIQMVLDINRGNIPAAAKILDIAPSTLYRKCASWTEDKSG